MLDMRGEDRVQERTVQFQSDGVTLCGTYFTPEADPVAAVVLNGATGVPHQVYRHFARWLVTERGMACLTYDYRCFGASATSHPKQAQTNMTEWSMLDQPAARRELRRLCPGVPLWVIGHSLGGMTMPMQPEIEDVERMIGVACGLVHLADHPWPYRALASAFWFGPGKWATDMAGYLPGRRLGFGPDLPEGVYREWRDWCTSPRAFLPRIGKDLPWPHWGRSGAPVELISFSDDQVCPPRCSDKLAALYDVRVTTRRTLTPTQFGLGKVGHLGAFTRQNAVLWPEIVK
ncbi:MAG: alpha/beta fold hydrolase [Paracoccaceae bacterium]